MENVKKITGHIFSYSRKARDMVTEIGKRFLMGAGIHGISSSLFSCVDELVKNAVKANYKFILIIDEIVKNLQKMYPSKSEEELRKEISDIIKINETFNHLANEVLKSKNISQEVREILNEESKYLTVKDRAYMQKRGVTPEEQKLLAGMKKVNHMKKRIKEKEIKIILKMQSDEDFIYIEVTNTAPILTKDLNRIYRKRDEYKKYRDEGKEQEFFINNLDTSESGFGLGYATIDSILCDWGLDPERAATIISSIDTTVMLTIPISELKRKTAS